jgi:hypothetical protein
MTVHTLSLHLNIVVHITKQLVFTCSQQHSLPKKKV